MTAVRPPKPAPIMMSLMPVFGLVSVLLASSRVVSIEESFELECELVGYPGSYLEHHNLV